MGLSFHYSGRISDPALLPGLIEEVRNVAEEFKWSYHIFEPAFPEGELEKEGHDGKVYGIWFNPPECEPVSLAFLSNGRLSSPGLLMAFGDAVNPPESEYLYMVSVKTLYSGVENHRVVIHLLRYLSDKYLSDFKLMDEGRYWETNDPELLENKFIENHRMIDAFSEALRSAPRQYSGELLDYLEKIIGRAWEKHRKREEGESDKAE